MNTIKKMEIIQKCGNTSYSFFLDKNKKICYNKRAKKGYDIMNKIVLITGSSRGIGKETAIEFAKEGYDVIITYFKEENKAKELKTFIEKEYNVNADIVKLDLSSEDSIKSLYEYINDKYNRLDVLVNNAAIAIDTLYEDKTKEDFMKILEVNLVGTFLITKCLGKIMMNNKKGKIINISSDVALGQGYPESIDYDASKAGIISLTHDMAKYYAPYINVNAVAPGWTLTDMNKELDKDQINSINKKNMLNRFATPEEIANVIVFLASDKASYINDEIIKVNGGIYE